ncbi:hypothetical protein BDW67DRAFT_194030 [Aspergillus spinulosporus]
MLGVLKSGAAFILLDPAHPIERLRGICKDTGATVILTSAFHRHTASQLAAAVEVVSENLDTKASADTASLDMIKQRKTEVTPRNAAYISYTSGSTGRPKGTIIEHASVCTNAVASSEAQGLTAASRVLQFASYAFDVSIHETLFPLMLRGCVCIPSELQRVGNLQAAIVELGVNWIELTPSVARLLNPEDIPGVDTLVVGGEPMSSTELVRWATYVRVVNAYGPAERTVVSTVQPHVPPDGNPLNIDLVRQQADGTLIYLGRKDTQVKLRGQRIELGEIEHHAGTLFPHSAAVVDMCRLPHGTESLVLFIECGKCNDHPSHVDKDCRRPQAKTSFETILPRYMVPSLIVPLRTMPLSPTGKVDRKALRTIASQLSRRDIQTYSFSQAPDRVRDIQGHIVARGTDDFFQLGGDSISAIKLVNEAQNVLGIRLTVADIFQHPTVLEFSQQAQRTQCQLPVAIDACSALPPFSMLDASEVETLKELAVKQCSVLPAQIEDIYPCSPLQEQLMARTARLPGAFQAHFTFHISPHIDWARFRGAWDKVAMAYPIMRTRIITTGELSKSTYNTLQVVIRGEYIETREDPMTFGTPLTYIVASRGNEKPTVTLVMHHAVFDWSSYNKILEAVQVLYEGRQVKSQLFSPFIKYINELDRSTAREFWRKKFQRLRTFHSGSTPQLVVNLWALRRMAATTANIIRLTWALVLAQLTGSSDVVFGVTAMARNIPGAAEIGGPTIATYPVRVTFQHDLDIDKELQKIQDDAIAVLPFEQTGLREIQQSSPEAAMACKFQSLLVVKPQPRSGISMAPYWELDDSWKQHSYVKFSTQLLNLVCEPAPDKVTVNAFYDRAAFSSGEIHSILQRMEDTLNKILHCADPKTDSVLLKKYFSKEPKVRVADNWLAQLELSAREYLGNKFQVAAERVTPKGTHCPQLVLFKGLVLTKLDPNASTILLQLMLFLRNRPAIGQTPCHCIPVQLEYRPSQPCLLLDRARAREDASKLTWSELRLWETKVPSRPLSVVETKLKRMLASVLRLMPDEIDVNDDFALLGCDSLVAMQFAAKCNRGGIAVTVPDIFKAKCLESLALMTSNPLSEYSPSVEYSNFSLLRSLHGDLESFERDVGLPNLSYTTEIVDAYPCTSSHLGLLSDNSCLQAYTIWEVSAPNLIARHPTLRTVLLQSRSNPSKVIQVVLSLYPVDTDIVTGIDIHSDWPTIRKPFLPHCDRNELPYKFSIYQTTGGQVFCKLEGKYAILDATSILILLQELGSAYNGILSPATHESHYRLWVSYLQQWTEDHAHLKFWKRRLADVRPCIFRPGALEGSINGSSNGTVLMHNELRTHTIALIDTREAREYCSQMEFSLANVFQVAWALTLQQHTALNDVCFGTLVSCRDAPVSHVSSIVGSLFNVLLCHVPMSGRGSLHDILEDNELASREIQAHQHCSLKDVVATYSDGQSQLFNTCLSVEQPLRSDDTGIEFRVVEIHEETQYDIIVTIIIHPDTISAQFTYWTGPFRESHIIDVGKSLKKSVSRILSACETHAEPAPKLP